MPVSLTINHPAAADGVPVFLDENKQVMNPTDGFRAALAELGWDNYQAMLQFTPCSWRSVYDWTAGKNEPPCRIRNILMRSLRNPPPLIDIISSPQSENGLVISHQPKRRRRTKTQGNGEDT